MKTRVTLNQSLMVDVWRKTLSLAYISHVQCAGLATVPPTSLSLSLSHCVA